MPQVREGERFEDPNGLPRIAWAYIKLLEAQNKQALMRELLTAAASYMEQLDHEVCPASASRSCNQALQQVHEV